MATREQAEAAVGLVLAVGDVIKSLGSVPSGELYARLMDKIDIHTYESIIGVLVRAKVVRNSGHLLTWVGPRGN